MSKDDYKVGYKRAPLHGQFKPGHTRSRGRRRRKAPDLNKVILDEIASRVDIKEGGNSHRVDRLSALIKLLFVKSLGGDLRAVSLLLPLILSACGAEALTKAVDGLSNIEKKMLRRNAAALLASLDPDTDEEG